MAIAEYYARLVEEVHRVLVPEIRNPGDQVRLVLPFYETKESEAPLCSQQPFGRHGVDLCMRFGIVGFQIRVFGIIGDIQKRKYLISGVACLAIAKAIKQREQTKKRLNVLGLSS